MSGAKTDDEIVVEVYMSLYLNALAVGVGNELDNGIKVTEKFLSRVNNRLQIFLGRLHHKRNYIIA
mgnify:CR=1 FL=1